MHLEIKYLVILLSIVLIFGGLYFKFMYDVPDGEEVANMWVSWFLIIFGVIGILISTIWKKRNPLHIEDPDDDEGRDKLDNHNIRARYVQHKNMDDDIDQSDSCDVRDVEK
jgi:hypothetical protein